MSNFPSCSSYLPSPQLLASPIEETTNNNTNNNNNNNDNSPSNYGSGFLIGAKPGSIVERHIGSSLGDVVHLSPLQIGILRRFLPNGYVEFLLGNNVVKLEPGYELKVNETIAIRRRAELTSYRIQDQDVKPRQILILRQILANLICKDQENKQKLESLYTLNNQVITYGRVMSIYPEGMVLNSNLNNPNDISSYIFLGYQDLKDIKVLRSNSTQNQVRIAIDSESKFLFNVLSLDAGMQVILGESSEPKTIESIWWNKVNLLSRKAIFDGGRMSVSILSLTPYKDTLKRTTSDSPPSDRSYLRLYTEFQNSEGLLFSICGYDNNGVIANFKPPPLSSDKNSNSRGRCWVPFSFFDDPQESYQSPSSSNSYPSSLSESCPQISAPPPTTGNSVNSFSSLPSSSTLGKRQREANGDNSSNNSSNNISNTDKSGPPSLKNPKF